MTMQRLDALSIYWESNPPLHQLVAAYIGYEPKAKSKSAEENCSALVAMLGGNNG